MRAVMCLYIYLSWVMQTIGSAEYKYRAPEKKQGEINLNYLLLGVETFPSRGRSIYLLWYN